MFSQVRSLNPTDADYQIQTSLLLLAALGIFEQVDAHGRIVSWTVTSGGETTVQPGEDYNAKDDLVTAQRRKPKGVDPPDGKPRHFERRPFTHL